MIIYELWSHDADSCDVNWQFTLTCLPRHTMCARKRFQLGHARAQAIKASQTMCQCSCVRTTPSATADQSCCGIHWGTHRFLGERFLPPSQTDLPFPVQNLHLLSSSESLRSSTQKSIAGEAGKQRSSSTGRVLFRANDGRRKQRARNCRRAEH